jgi:hypothetical protein
MIYSIRAYIEVEKSGLTGPAFLKLLCDDHSSQRAAPAAGSAREGELPYPLSEQIIYNTHPTASPDSQTVKIVKAAFRHLQGGRGIALGAGAAAGWFGQFVAPFAVARLDNFGWQPALIVFAGLMLLVVPRSLALATPTSDSSATAATNQQTFRHALPKRYILSAIYLTRAVSIVAFITFPITTFRDRFRRRHGADLAVDDTADLKPSGADVRYPLARDIVRVRVLQPSGRRLPRRSAWRYRV